MGLEPLKEEIPEISLTLSPTLSHEDTARGQQSASQEEGSLQNPAMPTPWSQTLSFQNCGKYISVIPASCPGPPSTGCCDGSPKRPIPCPCIVFHFLSPFFFAHLLLWTSQFLHFNSFLCNGFLHSFLPSFLGTLSSVLFW